MEQTEQTGRTEKVMAVHRVEACFDESNKDDLVCLENWDFIGTVILFKDDPPEFIRIDGVVYERR
jgi:hypothetical protein